MRVLQSFGVAVACCVAACESTDPARVNVATSASPNPVQASEMTTVSVSVMNLSSRTIQVPAPNHCGYFFSIVDLNERRAELQPLVCSLVLIAPIELGQGETVTYVRQWLPSSATIDGQPLPAGEYMIRPVRIADISIAAGQFGRLVIEP
jgi:hypothetical protein